MQKPTIDPSVFIAKQSVVAGNVTIDADCSILFHATIRAEQDLIHIGYGSNIQDNAVVHVDKGDQVEIGEYVTVGESAVVHGCKIGNNTLIGIASIVLNGAKIGNNCIIGANSLVTRDTIIPDNSLVLGSPAKVIRTLTAKEIESNRNNALHYIARGKDYKSGEFSPDSSGS